MADEQEIPMAPPGPPKPEEPQQPAQAAAPAPEPETPPQQATETEGPPGSDIGTKLKHVASDVTDAVKHGYDQAKDFVQEHIDEAVEAGKGESLDGVAASVGKTVAGGVVEAANSVTDLVNAGANSLNTLNGEPEEPNALHVDTEKYLGAPRNWMESMGRSATSFMALAATTPEIKAGEGVGAIGKFALKTLNVNNLLTVVQDPQVGRDAIANAQSAPNSTAQRFALGALQAHTHPDVIDYMRNWGRNLLSSTAIEATMATGLALKGVAEKWAPEFMQKVLNTISDAPKDKAQIEDGANGGARVVPTEATLAANFKKAQTRQAEGRMLEANKGPQDLAMGQAALKEAGNAHAEPVSAAETPPGVPGELPEEEKVQSDSLLIPHPHENGPVDLPDHGQAEVEVAQRNASARNQDILEKGPGAFKDGWAEIMGAVRGGAPLSILSQISEHHAIEVPLGVTRDAIHGYIGKLAKMLKDTPLQEGGRTASELAENASRSFTPDILPRVALNRLAAAGVKDPQHYLAAAHMFTRIASAQAQRTAEALDLAPDSPAAQGMVDKTYETLTHVYDLMHGKMPQAEGVVNATTAAAKAPEVAAKQQEVLQPLSPQVRDQFARDLRIANGNPAEAMEAVKTAQMSGAAEQTPESATTPDKGGDLTKALLYYRVNNMIGGMGTMGKVALSQAFTLAKQPFEAFLGAPAHLFKGDTKAAASLFQEGYQLPMGYYHQFRQAVGAGARALRAGRSNADPNATLFKDGVMNKEFADMGPAHFLASVYGIQGRLHTTMTEFSKVWNYRAFQEQETIRTAGAAGESPENIANAVDQRLKRSFDPNGAIASAVGAKTGDPFDEALEVARRNTLTRPLDGFLMGDWVNKGLQNYPLIHAVVSPFMRIGINSIGEATAMTPGLAMIKRSVRDDMNAGGDRWARAIGNQVAGASLIAGGLWANHTNSKNFGLTGSPPNNLALRKQMESLGAKWHTLTVGPLDINLDRLPLAGPLLEAGTDLKDGLQAHNARVAAQNEAWTAQGGNKWCYMADNPVFEWMRHVADVGSCLRGSSIQEGGKALEALGLSTSKKMLNESWMTSATALGEILGNGDTDENERVIDRWTRDQMQTMVPQNAFWKSVNTDNTHREVRGVINSVLENMPGWSRKLEPEYNMFGQPETNSPGFIEWKKDHTENPARGFQGPEWMRAELLNMGASISNIKDTVPGVNGAAPVQLRDRGWDDDHEKNTSPYSRIHEILNSPVFGGQNASEVIKGVMQSDWYKALPKQDPQQPEGPRWHAVAMTMEELNKAAKEMMLAEPRYSRLQLAVEGEKDVAKSNKAMGRVAADSARNKLFENSQHILDSASTSANNKTDSMRPLIKMATSTGPKLSLVK